MDTVERLFVEGLNRATRAVLSVDPDSVKAFSELSGKVFCIDLAVPPLKLYLVPDPDGFSFQTSTETDADVTLSGTIFAFARLSGKGPASGVFSDGQVKVEGDAEAGQALQQILARFDLDWEELIARAVGDTPARKVGRALRNFGEWANQASELSRSNFSDYLTEESRVMASEVAMQRLEQGVNQLRSNTDRLSQRIARLQKDI